MKRKENEQGEANPASPCSFSRTDQRLRFRRNLRRYLILFGSTFALNLALLSFVTAVAHVPPLPAQFIVFPVVVVLNFLGGRLWAFRATD